MAITNHERVGKALEHLKSGLTPFVEREVAAVLGDKWVEKIIYELPDYKSASKKEIKWDTQALLFVMWEHWNDVFKRTLGHSERSIVSELRDIRNKWAHQESFSSDDAYRALDNVQRLLQAISAPEAEEVDKQRMELLRTRFDEQRRNETRKSSYAPVEGKPLGTLKPWREVVTPHPDVASGQYQQAEFAADLWQVYLKEGSDEYKHPTEFFRRTFLTGGLRDLLVGAIQRLSGNKGAPVVELQTNFGGGKTHSMLALYHLFSGSSASDLPGVEELLKEHGLSIPRNVRRAVFVGTKTSPGQTHKKPDGTVIRTMWGELAWQLGGKEGYKMVAEADKTATSPGDNLRELFNKFGPCVILIDEWVAYARQLHDDPSMPGGTFDTQFTFAQALSESAKTAKNALLVVSIPSSDNEIGGQWGKDALDRLKNAIGRIEAPWRPASPDEGFEIVRRRLFQPIVEKQDFIQRDAVARGFAELYQSQHQEFPSECREADYERRIKAAYPIHPELFDRLYNDWSALDKFQRTRGVLRLMAAVIHSLWERNDSNLLIMPATIPIDDSSVQFELTRYMEDQWVPVIEKDVDGPHSLPLSLDRSNPNLGRYSASRRVARTLYVGSAPTQRAANRGLEERQVKLGCVQPGESVATFGDALRRLTDQATYLYVDGKRYWYSTQPTVTRLADDRAGQFQDEEILEEIRKRLRDASRTRGDFSRVHVSTGSGDIPDEREAALVILGPEFSHTGKVHDSTAQKEAGTILDMRGLAPRTFRNTLLFLAADANRLKDLQQAVRQYLAWSSICREQKALNLDPFQTSQAETKRRSADETVDVRVPETYQWLLVPEQSDPKGDITWREIRLQGQDELAVRASRKLKNDGLLMTQWAGVLLRHELDRIPLWRGDHVEIRQLADDFAKYIYLPRLRDGFVLQEAIRDGLGQITWLQDSFAYADGFDEAAKRYKALAPGRAVSIYLEGGGLLVKSEVAAKQAATETPSTTASGTSGGGTTTGTEPNPVGGKGGRGEGGSPEPKKKTLRRFHGSVRLDPTRVGRDAGRIAEEIIQHLTGQLMADVEVTLEIQANVPGGVPEKTVRIVSENCRTLNFESSGFEES